jgi:transcriptional regulator with XRE-family HTH domain
MDGRADIRDYLISRRAKITPDQAGLYPSDGDIRRVPGLRREEVARLAGVSLDYYTEQERGALDKASDSVLDAVAHALQLDHAERAHLFDLARPAGALRMPPQPTTFAPASGVRSTRSPAEWHSSQPLVGLSRCQHARPSRP